MLPAPLGLAQNDVPQLLHGSLGRQHRQFRPHHFANLFSNSTALNGARMVPARIAPMVTSGQNPRPHVVKTSPPRYPSVSIRLDPARRSGAAPCAAVIHRGTHQRPHLFHKPGPRLPRQRAKLLTSSKNVNKVENMSSKFTTPERQVMDEFWNRGRLSIREIQESFPEADRPPYTSIQSIVYRLEEQGAVRRVRKIGNAHIFEAVTSRQEAGDRALEDLLSLFGGRTQTVMAHLVESGKLTRDDIRETEKLIGDLEQREKEDKQA
jgi:BlaI family transcriptional regulator, penicillinase repressor